VNSAVVWRGPSLFTGDPVQIVATGIESPSVNEKTGPMVQVSIVRQDGAPLSHFGTEREAAICGTCPLQGRGGKRICYVHWAAWLLGQHMADYPVVTLAEAAYALVGKQVRIGTYGDPAAVPVEVWAVLLGGTAGWTGYTHAWRTCDLRLRWLCMASVETREDYLTARERGWRTFRVKMPWMDLYPGEVLCPNESSGVQCINCGLCPGRSRPAKSIAINAHGRGASGLLRIIQPSRAL